MEFISGLFLWFLCIALLGGGVWYLVDSIGPLVFGLNYGRFRLWKLLLCIALFFMFHFCSEFLIYRQHKIAKSYFVADTLIVGPKDTSYIYTRMYINGPHVVTKQWVKLYEFSGGTLTIDSPIHHHPLLEALIKPEVPR